jgi:glycine dehydrogenase subunit 1
VTDDGDASGFPVVDGGNAAGEGSPFAPHSPAETAEMLDAVGVTEESELFDVPDGLLFDGSLDIAARDERTVRTELADRLAANDDVVEFLGRGYYSHYVPSVVDHLADRSEFLTSYTQYQPEVAQGFLQALFEYQSMLVELTGLGVANCSMYDHATALAEAAMLADRVRAADGDRVLVPDALLEGRRSVLENYTAGAGVTVEDYPTEDGAVDVDALAAAVGDEVAFVYVESPTARGVIEENLGTVADIAHDHDALCCLGSDPVALSVLEVPAAAGVDIVVGDAATLGMPTAYGMGLGLFACRESFLRQVPGRLVGASEDARGRRAYTLTLQTREQHIRRERATSNICTNQAWVALRTAMHVAALGADGLVEAARECIERPAALASRLDDIEGVTAPVHDRHHFREFVLRTDRPAAAVADDLAAAGYAVHAVGEYELQVCVTEANADAVDGLVAAFHDVAAPVEEVA